MTSISFIVLIALCVLAIVLFATSRREVPKGTSDEEIRKQFFTALPKMEFSDDFCRSVARTAMEEGADKAYAMLEDYLEQHGDGRVIAHEPFNKLPVARQFGRQVLPEIAKIIEGKEELSKEEKGRFFQFCSKFSLDHRDTRTSRAGLTPEILKKLK